MKVTQLYLDDRPNWKDVHRHLQTLTTEFGNLVVISHVVDTPEEAERTSFRRSQSIIVDGIDSLAGPAVRLSCRVYQTPDGPAGSPTIDRLRAVLAAGGA